MTLRPDSEILIWISMNLETSLLQSCLLLRSKRKTMDSKITIPEYVCSDEVVGYIASRYSITPQDVIRHFLLQEGIIPTIHSDCKQNLCFEDNEMTILRDMGICPSYVEFTETAI